ncbi:hypothetical protein FS837_008762 [Tulasnella sp. UAMH 9824]|nr:hypothetical protein FS837_008762 [Tulasnella sp. UAMH 9824]
MADDFLDNNAELLSEEINGLLEKSIFGMKIAKAAAPSVAGEANGVLERISLIMPVYACHIRHIPCSGTGKDAALETCLLLYDRPSPIEPPSASTESIIKTLSEGFAAFRWHHGPRLTKRNRAIVCDALREYLVTRAAREGSDLPASQDCSTSAGAPDREQAESNSINASINKNRNKEADGEEVAPVGAHSNTLDDVEKESLTESPSSDEVSSMEAAMTGLNIREAQQEAARAVIPVLWRNRKEEEDFVANAKALVQDMDSDPLPTSADGLSIREMIEVIGKVREREHCARKLEEQERVLNEERSHALSRLQPLVTLAGQWLEANGSNPQQPSSSSGDEVNVEEDSNASDHQQPNIRQLTEQNAQSKNSEEQQGIDATGEVVAEQESSDDSDFEGQLRKLQKDAQPDAEAEVGGSGQFDGQASLR